MELNGLDGVTTAVQLIARVRPLHITETQCPQDALSIEEGGIVWAKKGVTKALNVDAILRETASQSDVFGTVQGHVAPFVQGYDCSVLAYGHTGSGKTFTMGGERVALGSVSVDDVAINDGSGLIPRFVEKVFEACDAELENAPHDTFQLSCTYMEICNEKIYDLLAVQPLAPSPPRSLPSSSNSPPKGASSPLKTTLQDTPRSSWNSNRTAKESLGLSLRQHPLGDVYVLGLTRCDIVSSQDAVALFHQACVNRAAATSANEAPDGHTIFELSLNRQSPQGTRVSRLALVDLAGFTKPVQGIDPPVNNKSLATLTTCMTMLAKSQRRILHGNSSTIIPFRESVLTRLLQPFVQGASRVTFVLTLSQSATSLNDTCTTLRFAERLRSISCKPTRNPIVPVAPTASLEATHAMQLEMNRLRQALVQITCKHEAAVVHDKALMAENDRLRIDLHASQSLLDRTNQSPTRAAAHHRQLDTIPDHNAPDTLATDAAISVHNPTVLGEPSHANMLPKTSTTPVCPPSLPYDPPLRNGTTIDTNTRLPLLMPSAKDSSIRAPETSLPLSLQKKLVHVPLPMRFQAPPRRPARNLVPSPPKLPPDTPSSLKPNASLNNHNDLFASALPLLDTKLQSTRPIEKPSRRHTRRRRHTRHDDEGSSVAMLMSTPRAMALPKLHPPHPPILTSSPQPPKPVNQLAAPKEDSADIARYKVQRRMELEAMLGGDFLGSRDAYIFF
ncbi:hypothetical protein H257_10010 [Aphanomyces astaci]|uniref:Kinesin motor domain-containing protein n=1 Tax=Aphanomyces astaci TaxID=112090 RepID=W4G9J1_APHAT|nr:hypothetical protein H257_10010 [Aphanomyces astaci]ETV75598.1 hypothetical protein H257_10010 [Aphanomyces astaci]|eukprot:XP_009834729.1 hypothetical protein H257_10010 [Aphanomyces astaci]